jgi:ribosomal protein L24
VVLDQSHRTDEEATMAVVDHSLDVGDDVHVIAGPHQGHRATVVQLADPTGSRHTVRCEDGQTVRLSKVHVQRAASSR